VGNGGPAYAVRTGGDLMRSCFRWSVTRWVLLGALLLNQTTPAEPAPVTMVRPPTSVSAKPGELGLEARELLRRSATLRISGEQLQALAAAERALLKFALARDAGGEAEALIAAALVHRDLNDYGRAAAVLADAVSKSERFPRVNRDARRKLAEIKRDLGHATEALREYLGVLALERRAGDNRGEIQTLRVIAQVYRDQGRHAEAEVRLQEAVAVAHSLGELETEGRLQGELAALARERGDLKESHSRYTAALALVRRANAVIAEAEMLGGMASVERDQRDIPRAIQSYHAAIAARRKAGDRNGEARDLFEMARIERDAGLTVEALRHMRESLLVEEAARASLAGLRSGRLNSLETRLHKYHAYVALLLDYGMPVAAFKWAQKAKARELLDAMSGQPGLVAAILTDTERQEEARLRNSLALQNRILVSTRVGRKQPEIRRSESSVAVAEQALARFQESLYVRHVSLGERRAARSVTLDDIGSFLPSDSVLLDFVALDHPTQPENQDRLVCFRLDTSAGEPALRSGGRMPSCTTVATLADRFKKECASGDLGYRDTAKELYRLLIAPFENELEGKKRLIICPDGPLWGLPFHALLRGAREGTPERFIAEEFEIDYAYSASAARAAVAIPAVSPAAPALRAIAFADPSGRTGLGDLKHARVEVEAIRKVLPKTVIYSGPAATEEAAIREAGKYDILHFATHGLLNDTSPLQSGLVLAAPAQGSNEDGLLSAQEVLEMRLRCDVAVLSGCRTGDGQRRRGEGMLGLGWAFFAAGARSQVLTLWDIPDESTAVFMSRFYQNLAAGQSRGVASQGAARALLNRTA